MFNIILLSIHKTEKKNKKEKKREHSIKGWDRVTQTSVLCIHLLFADVLWVAGFDRYTHTEKKGGGGVTLNDQRG